MHDVLLYSPSQFSLIQWQDRAAFKKNVLDGLHHKFVDTVRGTHTYLSFMFFFFFFLKCEVAVKMRNQYAEHVCGLLSLYRTWWRGVVVHTGGYCSGSISQNTSHGLPKPFQRTCKKKKENKLTLLCHRGGCNRIVVQNISQAKLSLCQGRCISSGVQNVLPLYISAVSPLSIVKKGGEGITTTKNNNTRTNSRDPGENQRGIRPKTRLVPPSKSSLSINCSYRPLGILTGSPNGQSGQLSISKKRLEGHKQPLRRGGGGLNPAAVSLTRRV